MSLSGVGTGGALSGERGKAAPWGEQLAEGSGGEGAGVGTPHPPGDRWREEEGRRCPRASESPRAHLLGVTKDVLGCDGQWRPRPGMAWGSEASCSSAFS